MGNTWEGRVIISDWKLSERNYLDEIKRLVERYTTNDFSESRVLEEIHVIQQSSLAVIIPEMIWFHEDMKQSFETRKELKLVILNKMLEAARSQNLTPAENGGINDQNTLGQTPINEAATLGDVSLVKQLLENPHCDVNISDNAGNVPLFNAIVGVNAEEVVRILLTNQSIDVNAQNHEQNFPLMQATLKDKSEIVFIILNYPSCEVNNKDRNGTTSFTQATKDGKHDIIHAFDKSDKLEEALLTKDNQGESPLSTYLKRFGDCSLFTYNKFWKDLPLYTINELVVNWAHHTLAAAIERCPVHVCERLLKAGADVNSSYPRGQTALMLAISAGNQEKVELLLKHKPKCSGEEMYQHATAIGCKASILQALSGHFGLTETASCSLETHKLSSDIFCHGIVNHSIEDVVDAMPEHIEICSKIGEVMLTVLKSVSQETEHDSETSFLAFTPVVVGSLSEKTPAAGDIDIACVVNITDDITFQGNILKVPRNSKWKACSDNDGVLLPKVVMERFCDNLNRRLKQQALSDMTSVVQELHLFQRDKVPCLRVLATDIGVKCEVFIDIVPIFKVGDSSLIPKISRHNNDLSAEYSRFQITHNQEQGEVIGHLSAAKKAALQLAKLSRAATVCKLDDKELARCYLSSYFDTTTFVTSCMLKQILFKFHEKEVHALDIIKQLLHEVQNGRVESSFDGSKLLYCEHNQNQPLVFHGENSIFAACCLKRITAMYICENIIKWMNKNEDIVKSLERKLAISHEVTLSVNCEELDRPMQYIGKLSCPVHQLKTAVSNAVNIPAEMLQLKIRNTIMEDSCTLFDYEIQDRDELNCLVDPFYYLPFSAQADESFILDVDD